MLGRTASMRQTVAAKAARVHPIMEAEEGSGGGGGGDAPGGGQQQQRGGGDYDATAWRVEDVSEGQDQRGANAGGPKRPTTASSDEVARFMSTRHASSNYSDGRD